MRGRLQWSGFVRFSVVGSFGVVVDMLVLFLIVDVFSFCVPLALAKLLAAETAMASNFVWNDVWTFRDRRARGLASVLGRFLRFNMVCSVGMFFAIGGLHLLHMVFGFNLYVANLVVIFGVAVGNFLASSWFVWKSRL